MRTITREQLRDPRQFPWATAFYYGHRETFPMRGRDAERAKRWEPGAIAIEVQHASEGSARFEIDAGKRRPEIGKATLAGPGTVAVWERDEAGEWIRR